MNQVRIVVCSGVTAIFVAGGLWSIFVELRRLYRVRTWPSVLGQVVGSQVIEKDNDGVSYNVNVAYQYKVMGYPHTGSTKIMGANSNDREPAEEVCKSYPAGLELPIAYNPERPGESEIADDAQRELKPERTGWSAIWVIGWILFWAFVTWGP